MAPSSISDINETKHLTPVILSEAPERFVSYQDHSRGVEGSRDRVLTGVTPSIETVRKLPGYRSLGLARRTEVVVAAWRQLRKRRRALLESNSPRNTQLETHRTDGAGRNS